jgi:type I restriction enzyme S subunit
MSRSPQRVGMGELLHRRRDAIVVRDDSEYKRVTIRLDGKGVELRDRAIGFDVGTKLQFVVRAGQFVLSKIDAMNGAFGVVPVECDRAIITGNFWAYDCDSDRIETRYLEYLSRTAAFVETCRRASEGTTNRKYLQEARFLREQIPLPPLAEQRRIVSRLDALAAKIEEAKRLAADAEARHDALFKSQIDRLFTPGDGWTTRSVEEICGDPQYGFTESASLEDVGPRFLRITDIQAGGVRWDTVPYCRCPNPSQYLLRPGDIVFARTGATTGKSFLIHDCPEAVFASYLIRLRVQKFASPEYLYWFFQTPTYWWQIAEGSVGTGQANVNGTKLRALRVPVAPASEQKELVARVRLLQDLTRTTKQAAEQALTRINALLPSMLDRAFAGAL